MNLIGKKVYIKGKNSYGLTGDWGIVKLQENGYYYIAIFGADFTQEFERDEFVLPRNQEQSKQ